MALPGVKQKCFICSEDVTEADYRRELTCSYTSCPGQEHAYHEDCINDYLKKLKLPSDRLIGYPCPVVLDNGRPCTGKVTRTHHRQPQNQKRKQKRVEAAADLTAALKAAKPAAPKPKEAKQGLAAATAAMRPAGEAVLRLSAGVNINTVKLSLPTVKALPQSVAPGAGAAARLGAIAKNNAMAPERVVRQRVHGGAGGIPGWETAEKAKPQMSALEQQRALVATIKAEARAAAGKGGKAVAAPAPAAKTAAGGVAGPRIGRQDHGDMYDTAASEDSDTHPFQRYLRDADEPGSLDLDSPAAPQLPPQEFVLEQEDFPAFPSPAGGGRTAAASSAARAAHAATAHAATEQQRLAANGTSGGAAAHTPDAGAAVEDPADDYAQLADDETDPIVATDPVFATEDGTVVVQDAHGNYVRMEEVYGASPELRGFADEANNVVYAVVIRQSQVAAQQALVAAQMEAAAGGGVAALGGSPGDATATVPLDGAYVHDQGAGSGGGAVAAAAAGMPEPSHCPEASYAAAVEEGECEEDLEDLLALMGVVSGGGADAAVAAAPAAPAPTYYNFNYTTAAEPAAPSYLATGNPYGGGAAVSGYTAYSNGAAAAGYPPYGGGYGGSAAVAPAAAPPVAYGYGAASEQQEGEDMDSLLQLLCV